MCVTSHTPIYIIYVKILKFYILHEITYPFLHFSRKILHRDLKSKNIFLKNNLLKIGKIFKNMCSRNMGEYTV